MTDRYWPKAEIPQDSLYKSSCLSYRLAPCTPGINVSGNL